MHSRKVYFNKRDITMWLFVFLICSGESILSNAERDIDSNTQLPTEINQPNQGVNWNNIRPPVTLTIRDGRSGVTHKPQDEAPSDDRSLFYTNQWQPFIVPIDFNQFEDRRRHQTEGEYNEDTRSLLTFLSRPEFDTNRSAPNERDAILPTQTPFSQVLLYPNPFNLYPNTNSEGNAIRTLQNNSTPSQQIFSDSAVSNTEVNPNEILQSERTPITADIPRRFYPLDFYRQLQEFTSPRSRMYIPPYPFLPIAREDALSPGFVSESGFEGNNENGVSEIEKPVVSEVLPEESILNEASPNITPLPSLPFSFGTYAFGIVPPARVVPPVIPNVLSEEPVFRPNGLINGEQPVITSTIPRSLPFNPIPFVRITNVRGENPADGTILTPPPVLPSVVASPPLEPADVVPPVEVLEPDVDENSFEESLPGIPYEFGYDMNDGLGTDQHRKEVSDGAGVVTGSYGYRDLFGVYRLVNYIADKGGFRAIIKSNEPGVATSRSADVVIVAEPPPPHAVAEGITIPEPEVVIAADEPPDLTAAASEIPSN